MKKKERILLEEDQNLIAQYKGEIASLLPLLQSAVSEWESLKILPIKDVNELVSAISSPKEFYDSKIIQKLPDTEQKEVAGFKVKKDSILDSLELPNPSQFYSAALKVNERLKRVLTSVNIFHLENGIVSINEDEKEAFFDSARCYAESEKEHQAVSLLNDFIKASEELDKFIKENGAGQLYNYNSFQSFRIENFIKVYPDGLKLDTYLIRQIKRQAND